MHSWLLMSPDIWESPETFDPTRFERRVDPVPERSWSGYDPEKAYQQRALGLGELLFNMHTHKIT